MIDLADFCNIIPTKDWVGDIHVERRNEISRLMFCEGPLRFRCIECVKEILEYELINDCLPHLNDELLCEKRFVSSQTVEEEYIRYVAECC